MMSALRLEIDWYKRSFFFMRVTVWNSVYVDEASSKGVLLVSWHAIPAIVIIPSINSNLFIGWMRILFRSANTWYTFASPKMPFIHSNLVARAFGASHLKSKNQSFSLFSKWKLMRLAIYKKLIFFTNPESTNPDFFPPKFAICFPLLKAKNWSRKGKNDFE